MAVLRVLAMLLVRALLLMPFIASRPSSLLVVAIKNASKLVQIFWRQIKKQPNAQSKAHHISFHHHLTSHPTNHSLKETIIVSFLIREKVLHFLLLRFEIFT
jgi:hypothetical protein